MIVPAIQIVTALALILLLANVLGCPFDADKLTPARVPHRRKKANRLDT